MFKDVNFIRATILGLFLSLAMIAFIPYEDDATLLDLYVNVYEEYRELAEQREEFKIKYCSEKIQHPFCE